MDRDAVSYTMRYTSCLRKRSIILVSCFEKESESSDLDLLKNFRIQPKVTEAALSLKPSLLTDTVTVGKEFKLMSEALML